MPYLLDTNVVSEAIKPRPEPRVLTWLAAQPGSAMYLSVLTLGELEQGIARSPHPLRAARLGRGAGFVRNRAIVEAANVVVAFWDGRSRGTAHTIGLAREAGRQVVVYR